MYAIFSSHDFYSMFSEKKNKILFSLLNQNGGFLYDMVPDTKTADQERNKSYRFKTSKTKTLPKNFHGPTDIVVAGDITAMISFANRTATVIQDLSIAKTQRALFQSLWKKA